MRILGTQRTPVAQVHVEEVSGVDSHTEPGDEGERVKGGLFFSCPLQIATKWLSHSTPSPQPSPGSGRPVSAVDHESARSRVEHHGVARCCRGLAARGNHQLPTPLPQVEAVHLRRKDIHRGAACGKEGGNTSEESGPAFQEPTQRGWQNFQALLEPPSPPSMAALLDPLSG